MPNWKITIAQKRQVEYDDSKCWVTDTITATGFDDTEEAMNFAEQCLEHCKNADVKIENEKEES